MVLVVALAQVTTFQAPVSYIFASMPTQPAEMFVVVLGSVLLMECHVVLVVVLVPPRRIGLAFCPIPDNNPASAPASTPPGGMYPPARRAGLGRPCTGYSGKYLGMGLTALQALHCVLRGLLMNVHTEHDHCPPGRGCSNSSL